MFTYEKLSCDVINMHNNPIIDKYNFENKNEYEYNSLINEYNNNTLINWSDKNVNSIINEYTGNKYTLSYEMDVTLTDFELTEMYNNNIVSEYKALYSPTIDFKLTESENVDYKHNMESLEESLKDIKSIFDEIQTTTQEIDLITAV